jgi:hypothetical protein
VSHSIEGISNTRDWWLMPVIQATQKAEIRKIMVGSHPRQTVHETNLEKTITKKGSNGRAPA